MIRGCAMVVVFGAMLAGLSCAPEQDQVRLAKLVIASAPVSGAEVLVNGRECGATPVVVDAVPVGPVHVRVSKEGYRTTARVFEVYPVDCAQRIVVEMEPRVGYLTVTTKPSYAQLFLDGTHYLGDTPIRDFPVPIGEHTYTLKKPTFISVLKAFAVEEDYRYRFAHELEAEPGGLLVLSQPSRARVWINDELQGQVTPCRFDLSPGDYTVRVHAKGYLSAEEHVELRPNVNITVDLKMRQGEAPPGMVLVAGGEFIHGVDQGAPDEQPKRRVFVDAFYIDRHEVTHREYKAAFPSHEIPKGREDFPVSGLSGQQAEAYARKVGKRLPTETEWEKAARSTDGREYPWGNVFDLSLVNCKVSNIGAPQPVTSYRRGASEYGCLNMAGNVYEWTSSLYKPYPGNEAITHESRQLFYVLRGGSYMTDPYEVRCARRHFDRWDAAREDYGVRCVRDIHE